LAFNLTAIAVFGLASLLYLTLVPPRFRTWILLLISAVAIYWLQPRINVRYLDFIFPSATLSLTVFSWWITRPNNDVLRREDRSAFGIVGVVIVGLSLMRFVEADFRLTPSRPPDPIWVIFTLALVAVIGFIAVTFVSPKWLLWAGIAFIILLFIVFKTEPLAAGVSRFLRGQSGQDVTLASALDLNWLGFSYVAFRLLHTYRDRQRGLLPDLSLREYLTYVIFFPSFIAGPIDRAERFAEDLRALPTKLGLDIARITDGMTRIGVGIFKKFIVADTLAQGMALDMVNAVQTTSTLGYWLLLYGYAFRLFFDFSGYSDIAIGLGILFGIRLPENFDRPYLKTNITAFWQSWHITLSQWVRFYVFSPLSRSLLTRQPKPSPVVVVFVSQLATMLVIGLWHGVSLNFVIWGLWHSIGLFVHKQWSDRTRKGHLNMKQTQLGYFRLWTAFAWLITFHFVVVGWVWFALPDVALSLRVLSGLFGFRP
jgi:D-alanyl-lipoteichoic acid acyltransferase DltB (MBOAT superfamily)